MLQILNIGRDPDADISDEEHWCINVVEQHSVYELFCICVVGVHLCWDFVDVYIGQNRYFDVSTVRDDVGWPERHCHLDRNFVCVLCLCLHNRSRQRRNIKGVPRQ